MQNYSIQKYNIQFETTVFNLKIQYSNQNYGIRIKTIVFNSKSKYLNKKLQYSNKYSIGEIEYRRRWLVEYKVSNCISMGEKGYIEKVKAWSKSNMQRDLNQIE